MKMPDEARVAGLRYVDPEPPRFPGNRAWDFWKVRDDKLAAETECLMVLRDEIRADDDGRDRLLRHGVGYQ